MTEEQYKNYLEQMKLAINAAVAPAIETNVNGKIRNLTAKLDEYIKDDDTWKDQYMKDDKAWKDLATPAIELGNNMRGFGKVFAYFTAGFAGMYGLAKFILLFATKR